MKNLYPSYVANANQYFMVYQMGLFSLKILCFAHNVFRKLKVFSTLFLVNKALVSLLSCHIPVQAYCMLQFGVDHRVGLCHIFYLNVINLVNILLILTLILI